MPYTRDFDWSPDGARIAFGDARQVIIIDTTGRNRRQLTSSPGDSHFASWSPDGSRLVYWNNDDPTRSGLIVVRADGSAARRLAATEMAVVGRASWSPDGTRIVFAKEEIRFDPMKSEYSTTWSLFVADVETDTAVRLTTSGPCVDREPTWAPNGDRIVFEQGSLDNRDVFSVALDGGDLVNLTATNAAFDGMPRWRKR